MTAPLDRKFSRCSLSRSFYKEGVTLSSIQATREETLQLFRSARRTQRFTTLRKSGNNKTAFSELSDASKPPLRSDSVVKKIFEGLPQLVNDIQSDDASVQLKAATSFRKILSLERNPPIQQIIDLGVVPRLVQLMTAPAPKLQFEAAWALTNIASGTSEHTKAVIDQGAVPVFVSMLRAADADVRDQAVWALGNIAGDSPACRDYVLGCDTMASILQLLVPSAKASTLRNATWAVSNLCRGKPQPKFETVSVALPKLAQLLSSQDSEVLTDACWALSYLSDGANEKIQAVLQAGVAPRLVELLMHQSPSVQTPALRTIGNIVTGDDMQTQVVVNCGALPCFHRLLGHPKRGIRKECCWAISNITAGNKEQIQTVIDANIFPPLIQLLAAAEFQIKKEACWAVSNATSGGSPEQLQYLVNQGAVPPLVGTLSSPDARVATVSLEALENFARVALLKSGSSSSGGSAKMAQVLRDSDAKAALEQLQAHDNSGVAEKAMALLEKLSEL